MSPEAIALAVFIGIQVVVLIVCVRCCRRNLPPSPKSPPNRSPAIHLTEVLPRLFVCGELSEADAASLQERGVTHVVCIGPADSLLLEHTAPALQTHAYVHTVRATDVSQFTIAKELRPTSQFIAGARDAGSAVVISGSDSGFLSAALAMAHAMLSESMSLRGAFVCIGKQYAASST